ncbi:hypothetical protein PLESTB_000737700 [Pleodorina starrii]|uniref:MYND-type domain-containing protein n=1 Tax=Pleodorina starrii TaxID=330485 RepID=A0A9W6BJK2_9CHLO|nr:hypothetical protein PLESTM_000186600 [Pleodorina starrii]GLC53372.1 hypothetical protein PLESTB_000737700 [Pleodorina starrii]GLC67158.1 hypothetical protein PLESTF_000523400 [Pleodorina starrii]
MQMQPPLEKLTRLWREVLESRPATASGADLRLAAEIDQYANSLNTIAPGVLGGMPMAFPPAVRGEMAMTKESTLNALHVVRLVIDLGVVTAAVEAVSAGQRALQSGKASLSTRAAAVIALEVLGFGAGATQILLFGIKSGALGPVSSTRRGRTKSDRQRALDTANASILQLCKDKALQAAASLLSTVTAQRAARHGADARSYSIPWGSGGGGSSRCNTAFHCNAVQIASDLGTVIQCALTLMYGAVAAVYDLAMGAGENDGRGAVVAALLSELEQSRMLDVAAATLLATPPPPPSFDVSLIAPLLARATSALACSTSRLASLAYEAGVYDPDSSADSASDDDDDAGSGDRDAVGAWAGTRHPETLGRLCKLIVQPSLARMQRALLERFCRNGGGDGAVAREDSTSVGGSGWPLMDEMRLDSELSTMHDNDDATDPSAASGHVIALLILALPALTTWAAISTTPALHGRLPAYLDEQLYRALCAIMRLNDGKGDAARGFGRPFDIHSTNPLLRRMWECNPGLGNRCLELSTKRDEPMRLNVTPTSLSVMTRLLGVQARLALATRQLPPATGGQRWMVLLAHALSFWRHAQFIAGWNALGGAARDDAIRRLARAEVLPALELVLRLSIPHAEIHDLLGEVLPAANTIIRLFMLPILQVQAENGGGGDGGGGCGAGDATAGASDPRVNLGLLLTLSKAAGRLARQLDDTTAAAAAHGFSRRAGAADVVYGNLNRLRHCAFLPFSVFVDFSRGVGPLGYEAGLARLAARPEVVAVSELAARSAIIAVRSYLASMEAEQRVTHRRGGTCAFSDNPARRRQLAKALEFAPACVTAVAAMGPAIVPTQELLALRPQQLLADCCSLTLDWARVCDADPPSAPSRRGGPHISNPVLAAMVGPDPDGRRGLSGERFYANRATAQLLTALLALAAREDTAQHMCEWLGGGGTAAAAPPPLRQSLRQLLDGAPEWLLSQGVLHQRTQMETLMEAAAAAAALRAAARTCLLDEHQLSLATSFVMGPLVGMSMDAAALRRCPGFASMQAMPLAGLPPAEDARGERIVPAPPPPGELKRCAFVKVCGNPRCDNFEGPCEESLSLKKCGRCKAVRYCGAACQQQHWPEHKKICQLLRC